MAALFNDPLTRLLAQAIVIITASRLVGLLARRISQPFVIAEVVAGILLGPSLLGWVAPDVSAALFPASSLGIMQMIAQLGVVLFMFLVGLELDPKFLRGRGHTSASSRTRASSSRSSSAPGWPSISTLATRIRRCRCCPSPCSWAWR